MTGPTTTGDTNSGTTTGLTTVTTMTGEKVALAGTGFPAAPLLSLGVLPVIAGGAVLLLCRQRRAG